MNKRILISLAAGVLVTILACRKTQTVPAPLPSPDSAAVHQTLLQRIQNNFDFSEFYNALVRVHLDTLLSKPGPYTLLIPDNVALQAQGITADSLAKMDTGTLRNLLAYHILPDSITYASVPQSLDYVYNNIEGQPVYFSVPIPGNQQDQHPTATYPVLHINGVNVTAFDVIAANGVIQVLASTLPHPAGTIKTFLVNNPNYSLFTQALAQFNLLNKLDSPGHQTVLAEDNSSFQNWGIDSDSISRMNPTTYKPYLFGANIVQTFFFNSDMADGPQEGAAQAGDYYITPLYVLNFSYGSVTAYPLNYIQQQNFGNYLYPWGDQCYLYDYDHLATNGIVQGMTGLLIYPDSAIVNP